MKRTLDRLTRRLILFWEHLTRVPAWLFKWFLVGFWQHVDPIPSFKELKGFWHRQDRRPSLDEIKGFWHRRDRVPSLEELKADQYVASMNPSDNVQQAMNLVIPLKDPTPAGRALLVQMLASKADEVVAGLHNTGIVHFARFTIVGDNLLMFSIFDGDFANYIRDFVYNIGSFFDHLMEHTTDPAPTPVEQHPDDFVDWVKRVDAWQLGEDITALSPDIENLGRRLVLHMARAKNVQMFVYRGYPGSSVAEVRNGLKVGW